MKKHREWNGRTRLLKKLLRIMKLTSFLILVFVIGVSASSTYSQTTKLNIRIQKGTFVEVLKQIEKQSEYYFYYNNDEINRYTDISIDANDIKVEDVLGKLLRGTDLDYKIIDRYIAIKKKDDLSSGQMEMQQQKSVSGKVTDSSGSMLPGVSVVIKGTTQGVITDANGNYSLSNVTENSTLQFSFVGMKMQEIVVGSKFNINVSMVDETIGIEEVVAIGYGKQKKVNLTGSVSVVSDEELVKRPAANTSLLLQGKVPGLQIIQNSAQPGKEDPSVQIHGVGTFSAAGNNPLVLIDGVQGSLSAINPNMIETISVLKDAASSAIYGVQGANGVILITTKSGLKGRLNIEYSFNYGIQSPSGVPDLIWNSVEFMELSNEGIIRTNQNTGKLYSQDKIDAYRNGAGSPQFPNTNWADLMFNNAGMQQHYLSVNGGEGKTTYNFGLGYLNQEGILLNTGYKKYDVSFNFKTQMSKFVTFGSNIMLLYGDRDEPVDNAENLVLSIYSQHPLWSPYLPDGSGRVTSKAYDFETTNQNAYAVMQTSSDRNKEYGVSAISFLNFNIAKGLIGEVKGAAKYNTNRQTAHRIPLPTFLFQPDAQGVYNPQQNYQGTYVSLRKTDEAYTHYTLLSTLTYDNTINDVHHITALAGYNQENRNYEQLSGYRQDFPSEDLPALNAGGTNAQSTTGFPYQWSLQSVFGRFNYVYDGRFLFETSLRYDGSSKFRKGKRWGIFPSVSAGWRISQEKFLEDIDWLSELKVRASYGQLGNQNINNYPYQNLLDYGTYIYNNATTGLVFRNLVDEDITWETTIASGVGLDFGFWKGKLSGTFDYFNKVTKDILRTAVLPAFVGMGAPTVNSGEMKNTGFEFSLSHQNRIGEISYGAGLNFYTYKNEVVKFGAQEIQNDKIRREGLPWNSWYMLDWIGVFQNQAQIDAAPKHQNNPRPGDLIFADHSGPSGVPDGKIDSYDRIVIKGQHPDFNYGFNFNLGYKGIDLSAFFQGVAGTKVFTKEWGYGAFRQWSPPPTFWRERWTIDNPTNKLPGMYVDNYAPITTSSSFWLQNASYLRLKNVSIGYTFSSEFTSKLGMQNLRLYFSGDNLLTFTDFVGDPERVIQDNTSGRFAIYPQAKVFSFGIKTTF